VVAIRLETGSEADEPTLIRVGGGEDRAHLRFDRVHCRTPAVVTEGVEVRQQDHGQYRDQPDTAGTEECCVSASSGGGGATQACVAKGSCNSGAALTCASAATCGAGHVCCLELGTPDGSIPTTSTCETSCATSVDAGAGGVFQLCSSDGECKGGPAAGQWFEARALEMARNAKW